MGHLQASHVPNPPDAAIGSARSTSPCSLADAACTLAELGQATPSASALKLEQRRSRSSSRYYGVFWNSVSNRWKAQLVVWVGGKRHYILNRAFQEEEEAAKAYDVFHLAVRGPRQAVPNFPQASYTQADIAAAADQVLARHPHLSLPLPGHVGTKKRRAVSQPLCQLPQKRPVTSTPPPAQPPPVSAALSAAGTCLGQVSCPVLVAALRQVLDQWPDHLAPSQGQALPPAARPSQQEELLYGLLKRAELGAHQEQQDSTGEQPEQDLARRVPLPPGPEHLPVSKFQGLCWSRSTKRWVASLVVQLPQGRTRWLFEQAFTEEVAAARAYDIALITMATNIDTQGCEAWPSEGVVNMVQAQRQLARAPPLNFPTACYSLYDVHTMREHVLGRCPGLCWPLPAAAFGGNHGFSSPEGEEGAGPRGPEQAFPAAEGGLHQQQPGRGGSPTGLKWLGGHPETPACQGEFNPRDLEAPVVDSWESRQQGQGRDHVLAITRQPAAAAVSGYQEGDSPQGQQGTASGHVGHHMTAGPGAGLGGPQGTGNSQELTGGAAQGSAGALVRRFPPPYRSRYRRVCWDMASGCWIAQINVQVGMRQRQLFKKYCSDDAEAACLADIAFIAAKGWEVDESKLNFPKKDYTEQQVQEMLAHMRRKQPTLTLPLGR